MTLLFRLRPCRSCRRTAGQYETGDHKWWCLRCLVLLAQYAPVKEERS